MRFRCVCKSRSALTCKPSFIETHRNFNSNKKTYLLLTTWNRATKQQHFFSVQINREESPLPATNHLLNLPTSLTKYPCLYNAQTINGLVCLYFPHKSLQNRSKHDHRVHLFNPCTRESSVLPYSTPLYDTFHVAYHFGFCPLTNEYQVLQVTMSLYKDMIADSLARVVTSFNIFKRRFHRISVCLHGAIHWMHGTQDLIVVFDLKDERLG